MKARIWLGLMSLVAASGVAANETGRWYVTPQAGGLWTDDDRGVDDGRLFGLTAGKHLNERWSAELNVNGADIDDLTLNAGSLDLLRVFRRHQAVSPYLTFGAGALRNDLEAGSDSTEVMAQAGVGLMWRLGVNRGNTSAFSLRPEIKVRLDDAGRPGRFTDYFATLGFQFSFGAPAAVAATASPAATPSPTPPPAPQQITPARPPAGDDDSDRDGVPDAQDACPDTPSGVAVDGQGCPQKGSIALAGVNFETDSATLTSRSHAVLDRVAADLKNYPRLEIELQGHTDGKGSERYNLNLSQRRAESVREYLLGKGVSPSQVVARGYGESQPVADNATDEGRARNRRVVMQVLRNPGDVKVEGDAKTDR